ncbi:MAG: aa3-type cytochrome oxidase subunit II, partial [Stackebrandtia sp.]
MTPRWPRRVVGAAVGGLLLTVLAGCSVEEAFSFGWPRTTPSPQSERMLDLWVGATIAALAVGVFVWGLIFWCVIRYRKKGDELPAQTRYNLPMEVLFTVTPFLVIAVLFYYTVVAQNEVVELTEDPERTVEVTAMKWNWEFTYPETATEGEDAVSTIGTPDYVPVMVVPTDERLRIVLDSDDVIHSFWVPDLLFKLDVMPGNVTNEFEVTVTQEGAYVGRCAELCGA